MIEKRRVVVTGLGALTPIGNNLDAYWEGLINGVSGAMTNPPWSFDISQYKSTFACPIKDYNPEEYFDKKEIKKLDSFSQYALVSSDEAIKDSKIDFAKADLERIGVVWGTGIGGLQTVEQEIKAFSSRPSPSYVSPFLIPKMISDIAAGHISIKYGLLGPNYCTVSACASSSNAIIDAFNLIKLNHADIILTGGSENTSEIGFVGFSVMKALSRRNDDPKTASRPFDKDRDGFVSGEGSGTLILEEYEHAKNRGAKIYAEILGIGLSADAYHITSPHPEGTGLKLVMNNAIKNAGIAPQEIDYINAHGTSTLPGDIAEIKAIEAIFKENIYNISISSTKSMTGHLLGASGAIEAIASILAITNNIVPPTINLFERDPDISKDIDLVPNKSKEKEVNISMSNNFGFGGHNCAIIFGKVR